jgi:hypothetical protein
MVRFTAKTDGVSKMKRRLEELRRNAEALDGTHHIPLTELFPVSFLVKNTEFDSLESMFEASGFAVESQEDFEDIPDDEWDSFIREHTHFPSWEEMLSAAVQQWAVRKLGLR